MLSYAQRGIYLLVAAWCLALLGTAPRSAGAEGIAEDQQARARELFREGVRLSDRGEWQRAAGRFEESLNLHEASTIRYNLAVSYVRLERLAEAAEHLEVAMAAGDLPDETRAAAERLLAEITPQLGAIEITRNDTDEVVISLDERALTPGQLERQIRVSPGSHVVTVVRHGELIERRQVEIAPGLVERVTLFTTVVAADEAGEADEADEVEGEPPDEQRRTLVRDWRLWVGIGAGVVAVVTAVVIGVAAGGDPEIEGPIPGNMQPSVLTWE